MIDHAAFAPRWQRRRARAGLRGARERLWAPGAHRHGLADIVGLALVARGARGGAKREITGNLHATRARRARPRARARLARVHDLDDGAVDDGRRGIVSAAQADVGPTRGSRCKDDGEHHGRRRDRRDGEQEDARASAPSARTHRPWRCQRADVSRIARMRAACGLVGWAARNRCPTRRAPALSPLRASAWIRRTSASCTNVPPGKRFS